MKNKKIWLDGFREIKHTLGRFLALLLIIALGTGFFVGIRAAAPDMIAIADKYFNQTNLEDMSIQSTMGLGEDDLALLEDVEDIEYQPYAYVDRQIATSNDLVRFYPNFNETSDINQFDVQEGRLPEATDEIAIDNQLANDENYQIGQEISLTDLGVNSEDNESGAPTLSGETFTIVGYVNSPLQITNISRGATGLGDGQLNGFAVLAPEAINGDIYTSIAIDVTAVDDLEAYSDEYDQVIADKQAEIEDIFADRPSEVYQEKVTEAESEIASGQEEIDSARSALTSGESELNQAQSEIDAGQNDLDQQQSQVEAQLPEGVSLAQAGMASVAAQLEAGQSSLDAAQSELDQARSDYESESQEAESSLASAEVDIADAESTVADLSEPTYSINDRSAVSGYTAWENNADNMATIGQAFPIIFFLIAALVSFTNMQRMVTEQRVQIGTYKALGYSPRTIQTKYIMYAGVAAILGMIIGISIGNYLFPNIIVSAFANTVALPGIIYTWQFVDISLAVGISLLTTVLPAWLTTRTTLNEKTARLLQPATGKNGQHIFLERFKGFWSRLSFQGKITWRNIFLYKGRNLMTIIGVAGCAMLIVTGFGLSDSISGLPDEQFNQVKMYDGSISLNMDASQEDRDQAISDLSENDDVEDVLPLTQGILMTDDDAITQQIVSVMAFKADSNYRDYFQMQELDTENQLSLPDEGILITAKLASLLGVQAGDTVTLIDTNNDPYEFSVKGVITNYLGHEIYMTDAYYQTVFGEESENNTALVQFENDLSTKDQTQIMDQVKDATGVIGTSLNATQVTDFEETLSALDLVTVVLIISAGGLAFIVLYSLTNINVSERMHELATVKVLGFRSLEVSMYVYRETLFLTVIGIIIGNFLGYGLLSYILNTVAIDQVFFPIVILWPSYLYASLISLAFSIVVMIFMHYKLKKVEMVSALKEED
ncbi:FtsX-like permease family protein [Aerococcus urinaeequi]|uniref:FtsX-like permease family protein n=1 Tax=Aerococcus urinaeequi TaxID=51665 RepID=UPI00288D2980|nr:FtsX-like permease family protein [Aerococcus urinaeequi]MDT2761559.1 ABC transporter permease [Aerococcus urinaeequi]